MTQFYEIKIKGNLDPVWTDWFEGMHMIKLTTGETILTGILVDQSALHGLLERIRDLNLELISVNRIAPLSTTDGKE